MNDAVVTAYAERRQTARIALYFGILTMAVGLARPDSGLATIPVQFFLKNRLHLGPEAMAAFGVLTSIPFFISFLFGFLRDRWRPFGWGDRGYFLLAAPIAVGCYLWLAQGVIDYARLLIAVLLTAVVFQLLIAAAQGLMTMLGQQRQMTGRFGALWMFAINLPGLIAGFAGGWMSEHISMRATFAVIGAITAVLFVQAFWRPAAVFAGVHETNQIDEGGFGAIVRLLRCRSIWPVALIFLLWNFSPGWNTPLLFYFTNKIKMSSEGWGAFQAISGGSTALVIALYGVLCRRLPLKYFLWFGTVLGAIAGPICILIHSYSQAIAVAVIVGLPNGIALSAYMDLLLRVCPKELEGVGTALASSAAAIATYSGDLFGSWLYQRGGFGLAMAATAISTALIAPLLLFLPRRSISRREEENGIDADSPISAKEPIHLNSHASE